MPTLSDLADWLKDKGVSLADLAGNLDQARRNVSIGNLTSAIDSAKRVGGDYLSQLLSDPSGLADRFGSQIAEDAANPTNRQAMLNTAMGFVPIGMAGVMTYHGTPHNVSAWDLSKVGTGQGAQSYGHGIYFAENPATAQSYKESLSYGKPATIEGGGTSAQIPRWLADNIDNFGIDVAIKDWAGRVKDAQSELSSSLQPWPTEEKLAGLQSTLDALQKIKAAGVQKINKPGSLYKQDLPDEVLPRMLQWDKPLSEQPQAVKDALSSIPTNDYFRQWMSSPDVKGSDILEALGRWAEPGSGSKVYGPAAAQVAAKAGIPGLSYLDAGSRGAGQGTMNHVIWDQDLLNRMAPQLVE